MNVIRTYFIVVIVVIIGTVTANHYIQNYVMDQLDQISIVNISMDNINRDSDDITPLSDERFQYVKEVDFKLPSTLNNQLGLSMIIGGISADGYIVELNDEVIYTIGDLEGDRANIWYSYYLVTIPSKLLQTQNTLRLTIKSDEYISTSKYPVYIGRNSITSTLYTLITFLTNTVFVVLVTFNIFVVAVNYMNAHMMGKKWGSTNRYLSYSLASLAIFLISFIKIDVLVIPNNYFAMITNSMMVVSVAFIVVIIGRIKYKILGSLFAIAGGVINLIGIVIVVSGINKDMTIYYDFFIQSLTVLIVGSITLVVMNLISNVRVEELDRIIQIGMGGIALLSLMSVSRLFNNGYSSVDFFSSGMILYDVTILYWLLTFNRRHVSRIMDDRDKYSITADIYKEQSTLDGLTQLYNRNTLTDHMKSIRVRPISIIFIDIDDFKYINDTYGHKIGDQVLMHIALVLKANEIGNVYRYGGEELVVLVEGSGINEAFERAEQLRIRIQKDTYLKKITMKAVTVSLGIASCPESTDDMTQLVEKADIAMYYAKKTGKNRSHIYNKEALDFYSSLKYLSHENKMLYTIMHASLDMLNEVDGHMKDHVTNVARYAESMGKYLGMDMQGLFTLTTGAYIHDIGKIALSEEQLTQIGPMDPDYKCHNELGHAIIRKLISDDNEMLSIVRNHHERYDGKGYPDGLAGDAIPLYTRIITILNTYEKLVSQETRHQTDMDQIIEKIKEESGTHFDPNLVEEFILMVNHPEYKDIFASV